MGDIEVGPELERTAAGAVADGRVTTPVVAFGARRCVDPVPGGNDLGHAGNSLGDFR